MALHSSLIPSLSHTSARALCSYPHSPPPPPPIPRPLALLGHPGCKPEKLDEEQTSPHRSRSRYHVQHQQGQGAGACLSGGLRVRPGGVVGQGVQITVHTLQPAPSLPSPPPPASPPNPSHSGHHPPVLAQRFPQDRLSPQRPATQELRTAKLKACCPG